ncbi:MAG: single-stranded DNA-binding protein [Chlamydiota bacterium]
MNRTILAGRLGKDPEVRYTSSGQKVTTLRLAVNQRRSGKEETMWWRITIWGERFDKMIAFLKKGSAVIVVGEMTKPQIYTDRDGNPQVSLDLVANDISFSPFGRSSDQSAAGESSQMTQHSFQERHAGNQTMHQQGEREPQPAEREPQSGEREPQAALGEERNLNFSEEEIPF